MPGSTEHQSERRELNGTPVTVSSYRVGDQWHCTIANIDPGANIARGDGATRDQAVSQAIAKATRRLK
jgi:hypothetical protein